MTFLHPLPYKPQLRVSEIFDRHMRAATFWPLCCAAHIIYAGNLRTSMPKLLESYSATDRARIVWC